MKNVLMMIVGLFTLVFACHGITNQQVERNNKPWPLQCILPEKPKEEEVSTEFKLRRD